MTHRSLPWDVCLAWVQRCVERAAAFGPLAALDDSARPGFTAEAKAWLVSLASKDFGCLHELWTMQLLARHVFFPQTSSISSLLHRSAGPITRM
jgi:hypothetical protein